MQIGDSFRANIVDVAPQSRIIEVTGDEEKVDSLLNLLRSFGLTELMRTGTIALSRGMSVDKSDDASDNGSRPRMEGGL